MKRLWMLLLCLVCGLGALSAQQIMYADLKEYVKHEGDTLTTLRIEKRSRNQRMLTGGAEYRLWIDDNQGLSRYLKKKVMLVQADSTWFVNCKRVRYKRLSFGDWYAPAMKIADNFYFRAQPLGSVAAECITDKETTRLGGDVGKAISASGIVNVCVYYVLHVETGKVEFVDREMMTQLLASRPDLLNAYLKENSELADVTEKYLRQLR
jgi:hypothetical protein